MGGLNSAFSLSASTTARSHEQIDKAMKDTGSQQIKVGEFKLTKQQEFQKAAKAASEGVSKKSKWAGYLGTGIVMGLGMTNPLTAGLVVGGMTAGGGILGKKTGKSGDAYKQLENSKWFQGDRDDVLKNIDKSLTTATLTNAVLAGASAHGAGKAATAATTDVVEKGGKEVLAEGGKITAKDKLKKRAADPLLETVMTAPGEEITKAAVPDMANIGTPANMFGKLKKAGGEAGEFLTTKPDAGAYKQLSLKNMFTMDGAKRGQFGKDFVGNLKASAGQFIPGDDKVMSMLKGGGTLNDWMNEEET
jgi:hypothetical protein